MTNEEQLIAWAQGLSFRIPPCGVVQLKGTDICVDITCTCGAINHFDGEHLHYVQCGSCEQLYMVGTTIVMHKVPSHLLDHVRDEFDVHRNDSWFQGPDGPDPPL